MPSRLSPGETFRSPGGPARFHGADDGPKGPGPALGEHTREILKSVGYGEAEVEGLYDSKAVA
jgi:crotonobetainyl-CoA:carnitine CoA-transferase CaiB-like acyl-CoA transferase